MTTWLLLAVLALSMVAVAGAVLVRHLQRRQQALQRRVAGLPDKRRVAVAAAANLVRRETGQQRTAATRLAALIRFDPARREQYRLPWFVVVGGAALVGRLIVLLAYGMVGPWVWLVLPVATVWGSRAYYAGADAKRRALLLAQFPDALALIVRAVRVGIPVTEALRAVSREAMEPTRAEFDRLQYQVSVGSTLEAALRDMALRNHLPEYSFFAAALALQAQTGGGLTATLDTLADIIRRRIAMKERGFALSSEARTSSLVLGALPLATGGMLYLVSPDYLGVLFTDPTGNKILGAAVLSLAAGMGAMRFIIRKSLA